MPESFIHLHAHSDASLQDGLFSPRKWAAAYKERGFIGAALTDHGSMANSIAFYQAMREQKLIPIMGSEVYYVDEPTKKTNDNRKASHLILLAKNYDGFVNLNKLMKLSFTEGYYYRNRIGLEWLTKHSEGLVCLTACQGGVLSQEVWKDFRGQESDLVGRFKQFREIFGKDLYVEFQGHNTVSTLDDGVTKYNSQAMINEQFYEKLRGIKGFQPIITNDCHYILPQHAKIQKLIKDLSWKQNNGGSADSATVTKDHFTDSLWMKNTKEVYQSFRVEHEYLPKEFVRDGMMATMEVFEKCKDFEMPKGKRYLPKFRDKIDSKEFFKRYTKKLLVELIASGKIHDEKNVYIERYKKECHVISSYNLEDYFLIVWDLVRFAKKEGIPVGIGRGSAAGCLISYLLGVVKIDPIEHKLIFERFLNENRCVSGELPDIDLDFSSEGRGRIKQYIFDTYGREKVCEIGTYTRMMLKTALLDFNRALNVVPHAELLKITTGLDLDKDDVKDLDKAIESSERLKTVMEKEKDYAFIVKEIIGQIKSQSIHPAGVIICSEPIQNITPLKTQKKILKPEEVEEGGVKEIRVLTTQSEDKYVIGQGLMKMDILGVKEYDVVKFIIDNAPGFPYTLENYDTEIMNIERKRPDAKIWKMFQQGKTQAVFQFSSTGMQKLLFDMRPNKVSDLTAANALYRPGCLLNGWHTLYINRKHGEEEVEYAHPTVEQATGDTYGVIVYQEQVMEVIHKLGKISLVDADTIRSALGKKDRVKLAKFKESFVKGAEGDIGKAKAETLWDQLEQSSEYSFNKCLAGTERFYRDGNGRTNYTIEEMFLIRNDKEFALLNGHKSLHQKYKHKGYGKAYSMGDDERLRPNDIMDIRFEGEKDVWEVLLESGKKIRCTLNHKFPTDKGIKKLEECEPGDSLYVLDKYEMADSTFRFGKKDNLPRNGQKGFQKLEYSATEDFRYKSSVLKTSHDNCQSCDSMMSRKEIHHKNGNHGDQDWKNLEVLCPSCHKKKHYAMGRVRKGEKGLLTKLEKIIEVAYIGKENVYDVEMAAPFHNFVTDDKIVTCNSHSAAYAVLAYISQWLKVYYPAYFWAGQIYWDVKKGDLNSMMENKRAAQEMGIEFRYPDINDSGLDFKVLDVTDPLHAITGGKSVTQEVLWSLRSVKGVGLKAAQEIVKCQPFKNFEDFFKKVNKRQCNYKVVTNLIYAGCFDNIGDRKDLLKRLAVLSKKEDPKVTSDKLLSEFYRSMGFYEQSLKKIYPGFSTGCITEQDLAEFCDKDTVILGGIISAIKPHKTKKGDKMGFLTLEDMNERIDVTVFPEGWETNRKLLKVGNIVEIMGKKSEYGGKNNSISMDTIKVIKEVE